MKYMKAIIVQTPEAVKHLFEGYTKKLYTMDVYALMASNNVEDVYFYVPETYLELIDNVRFNEIWMIGLDDGRIKDSIKVDAILRTMTKRGLVTVDKDTLYHIPDDNSNNTP